MVLYNGTYIDYRRISSRASQPEENLTFNYRKLVSLIFRLVLTAASANAYVSECQLKRPLLSLRHGKASIVPLTNSGSPVHLRNALWVIYSTSIERLKIRTLQHLPFISSSLRSAQALKRSSSRYYTAVTRCVHSDNVVWWRSLAALLFSVKICVCEGNCDDTFVAIFVFLNICYAIVV